jgi:hypothetical protein
VTAVFIPARDSTDKAEVLRAAAAGAGGDNGTVTFAIDVTRFEAVPRSPFAYWLSERLLETFVTLPSLNTDDRCVVSTNPLNDDFRYVRVWWETRPSHLGQQFRCWAKGGAHSPIYYDIDTVINWDADRDTFTGFLGTKNRPLERPASVQHFFRPGLTWPRRTQRGLSIRAMPAGCIFADKGPGVFVDSDDRGKLLALLAVMNSGVFRALVDVQMAFGSYEVGVIQRTPLPDASQEARSVLAGLARRSWALRRSLDTKVETSHAFVLPALLQVEGDSLAARADAWATRVRVAEAELERIHAEIDERGFDLYGIEEGDRRAIIEGLTGAADSVGAEESADAGNEDDDDEQDVGGGVDAADLAAELVAWAVGVAFGRFDVRLATGERALPGEPEPFDLLPVCSPAMLGADDGLPVASRPPGYPIDCPEGGVLVDDPGDPRDLTATVRAVFDAVFGAAADARWDEAAALVDARGCDLRAWLRSSFFERHLRLYSKSRRKAPILWQLGTRSGRYSIWLYAHRLTEDTFFQLQSDVLSPKLAYEERQLATLLQDAGGTASARERRAIEAQEAFVEELRQLLEEVSRVAPLWRPTLDDGVVLVMAPLWRLVPHRPWQRELKKKWSELAAGRYDWAQLAMHLWPERVIPKCAEDRSLAIAHGLEDIFWTEDDNGKWQSREDTTERSADLIQQRASPAAAMSLSALLDRQLRAGNARS